MNYLAILVAATASFIIGALWYGPLFGKPWKAMMDLTPEKIKTMKLTALQAMVMGFVSALVVAYVLADFVSLSNTGDAVAAFKLAFWIWLGFVATTLAGSFLWEGKPIKLFILNASYHFVSIYTATLILTLWNFKF